jgi:hypothetical protein
MFSLTVVELNRTRSLIILASLTLGAFLIFKTALMIDVSAFVDELDSPTQNYVPLSEYPLPGSFSPPLQDNQDIYGEYSDQYESGYFEDHYGKPYKIK